MVMGIITAVLPLLLKLVEYFLDKGKASAETRKAVQALIEAAKDDGLISIRNSDIQLAQEKKINDQIKKDKEAKNGKDTQS